MGGCWPVNKIANERSTVTAWPAWVMPLVVGLLGGVVASVITGTFEYSGHSRDLDAKMIELSVGILRSKPDAETMPLREWAIDVIQKRAGFTFTASQQAALRNGELPFKPGAFSMGYDFGSFGSDLMIGGKASPKPPPK
jgi:hypothetical protein